MANVMMEKRGKHGRHHRKLRTNQLKQIRELRAAGEKVEVLAMMFGVHPSSITRACQRA